LDNFDSTMFKIFFERFPRARVVLAAWALLVLPLAGCRTLGPFPAVDLNEPGWTVRQGQAVWKRPHGGPEIAGEVLVAWRDGGALVQFSKSPFLLVACQKTSQGWEIRVPIENRRYSGRGGPPQRMIWLQLPGALEGRPPPEGWSWKITPDYNWSLKNPNTGESIEGYFAE
jgi:hypothetical protein